MFRGEIYSVCCLSRMHTLDDDDLLVQMAPESFGALKLLLRQVLQCRGNGIGHHTDLISVPAGALLAK